jgi:Family of unknown function (DUF6941)
MQVKLALLADYANVTAEGKLNILGIFDRITVQNLPVMHPQMHLILRLEAASTERNRTHNIEIRLVDPDGETVFEVKGDMMPPADPGGLTSTNQILTLNNLQLAKAGGYVFVVFVNNDLKAEIPLGVEVNRSAPMGDRSLN